MEIKPEERRPVRAEQQLHLFLWIHVACVKLKLSKGLRASVRSIGLELMLPCFNPPSRLWRLPPTTFPCKLHPQAKFKPLPPRPAPSIKLTIRTKLTLTNPLSSRADVCNSETCSVLSGGGKKKADIFRIFSCSSE